MNDPPAKAERGVKLSTPNPPCGLFASGGLPTKQKMQGGKELLDPLISDAIPNRLTRAPKRDYAFGAHLAQMLRQCRLADADFLNKRANRSFAVFDQLTQDHEPPLVCEDA